MKKLPQNWRERPGRDPEREARRLKERFRSVTQRYERRVSHGPTGRRPTWLLAVVGLVALCGLAIAAIA